MYFKVLCDIFPYILHGTIDEQVARNFDSDQFGRIDAPVHGVLFIDVEAHRTVRKTQGIERGGVGHDHRYRLEIIDSNTRGTGTTGFVTAASAQAIGEVIGSSVSKMTTASGHQTGDRLVLGVPSAVALNSAYLHQPPSVSRVSLRLLRMQVKIGVSRSVYREPSVSRNAITKSKKSSGLSLSNATTHS